MRHVVSTDCHAKVASRLTDCKEGMSEADRGSSESLPTRLISRDIPHPLFHGVCVATYTQRVSCMDDGYIGRRRSTSEMPQVSRVKLCLWQCPSPKPPRLDRLQWLHERCLYVNAGRADVVQLCLALRAQHAHGESRLTGLTVEQAEAAKQAAVQQQIDLLALLDRINREREEADVRAAKELHRQLQVSLA